MPRRRRAAVTAALLGLVFLLVLGGGLIYASARPTAQSGGLRVYRESQAIPVLTGAAGLIAAQRGETFWPVGVHCDMPAGVAGLTPLATGATPTHPDGVAIGQHTSQQAIAARYIPANRPPDPRTDFPVLATVRYEVSGWEVLVTTCTAAPTVRDRQLRLGNNEFVLRPGQFAYTQEGRAWIGPLSQKQWVPLNTIVFTDGRVLVGISSSLSQTDLRNFARDVVVR